MTRITFLSAILIALVAWTACTTAQPPADATAIPENGVAILVSKSGSDVTGTIELTQAEGFVHVTGTVNGLTPGTHGFHIHQFGDLRDPNGQSAGGHYNPADVMHGGPESPEHHVGDLGNIEANDQGVATVDKRAEGLDLHTVFGRSIVVHGGADDLTSQPSGAAGPRVAVGVIAIAQPASP